MLQKLSVRLIVSLRHLSLHSPDLPRRIQRSHLPTLLDRIRSSIPDRMTFALPDPPPLSRLAVLVTLETAGAVLDLQGWQIRARIEEGTLAAFDLALRPGGIRPAWRIWAPSLLWDPDVGSNLNESRLVAHVTHQLFSFRPHILASEIALRCALECSVISRLVRIGALGDPGRRVAAYLMKRGGPAEVGRRRGHAHARLITRDSWSLLLAARMAGAVTNGLPCPAR